MSSTRVKWMWNSSANPSSKSTPVSWRYYSDVENEMIEEAFAAGETYALLDDYHVDFKHNLQISNNDQNKQRPVKRKVYCKDERILREDRFLPNPIAPDIPFGGSYGFISPFIKETAKHLNITSDELPTKNESVVPVIVEKAALGIVEEGIKLGKKREAEKMAKELRAKKNLAMKEVWSCCAHLYTLESFLYKKINEIMRLIGSKQHEQVWRSKISTLGPFCLLLWDNPFDSKMIKPGTILYRGANLPDHLITSFNEECSKDPKPWHTFQAFTSCSRNRSIAKNFGNVLFVMKTRIAFTVDLSSLSAYAHEEEELLLPGVSFIIDRIKFKKKHVIYLTLQQRHNKSELHHLDTFNQPDSDDDADLDEDADAALDTARAADARRAARRTLGGRLRSTASRIGRRLGRHFGRDSSSDSSDSDSLDFEGNFFDYFDDAAVFTHDRYGSEYEWE
ncbi:unnamed protein product [Adineta ricciae]|uniref:NAD(P)(+)--arginine ADP-ribosyltransferase n=1 Tax=Adineta ricciae TaxID=249248 RepID=A0A814I927_ADIRI|nr:unnamed protein product [Adineta ricciae]CAF1021239.1 unnamed protein product [Adineta ricciae]